MNILLIGAGGREHALAWKITQSKLCTRLFIAPGNAGTALCGTNVEISINDFKSQEQFCLQNNISLIVVGPEEPLVRGIYDYFAERYPDGKIRVIGPSAKGAMLEGSKRFAKEFMQRHSIPTASFRYFDKNTLEQAKQYVEQNSPPFVIKADGLAAGKGVLICATANEAIEGIEAMLVQDRFGEAGETVLIEEFLKGTEFSVFVLTDGKSYMMLPEAKDYKRIGRGDTGPNTGGMGAVSPVPFFNSELKAKVEERIIAPTIKGLNKEGIIYKGFIYFGLMNVSGEPYVIEYNCRLGDPEAEVILPRIETDLLSLFKLVVEEKLGEHRISIRPDAAATVVVASAGYPGEYQKGLKISLPEHSNSIIFHAGTKRDKDNLLTNGGRVFAVTSLAENISKAVNCSLNTIDTISFEGKYYRPDIGWEFI
ncbi:MAG: phosphoribosylamine--glycine ligase [Chitinophagales bacterium]|nr:phosphoribosylamine--glycine ligase [Chitinophagales bacterium]MDW8273468.1 phosphoribosylamine--glycine ligase [Chitinophagales bacterium]